VGPGEAGEKRTNTLSCCFRPVIFHVPLT
jgi:hypothetical protein